ncbi:MAG: IclR family transcriptional regulator [Paracoccaceae bacterium]|nr:IclR family transcriptional regulator [Paracoccaceae bacterium]
MHLDRLIIILEAVGAAGRPVTPPEVQQMTGLPRPTCYRLLQSMREQRLLDEPEQGRFLLGERMVRLGLMGQSDTDVTQAAIPTLKEAAHLFGEAVFLSRYRNKGVEIIHVEAPRDAKRSFVHPGLGFRPLHACSCSKVIAAYADNDFQKEIFNAPMKSYTDYTKQNPDALSEEFEAIRQIGYAECIEEIEVGVSSVAAPIRLGTIGAPFSIGATGPIRRFTPERRSEIGLELSQMAQKVSHALQVQGPLGA